MRKILQSGLLLGAGLWVAAHAFAADTGSAASADKKQPAAKKAAAAKSNKAAQKPAQVEAVKEESKKARKVVEGSVVHVSKRAISVEFEVKEHESTEMLLPLGANLTLEGGLKELAELKYGDQVKVGIEQTYKENADGTRTILKTEALVVALIKRASDAAGTPPEGAAEVQ